jgi:hypothetical protein
MGETRGRVKGLMGDWTVMGKNSTKIGSDRIFFTYSIKRKKKESLLIRFILDTQIR